MDRFGNIWLAFSNQSMQMYVQAHNIDNEQVGPVILNRLYAKRIFNFGTAPVDPTDLLLNFVIFKENEYADKIVIFFGTSKLLLVRHIRGSGSLEQLMLLPLYSGVLDEDW